MKDLKIDRTPEWAQRFFINGFLLGLSFFLSRVVFLTILLSAYIIPTMIDYDYESAKESIGSFRVVWMQIMLGLFIALYLMNIYWFVLIVKGSLSHLK